MVGTDAYNETVKKFNLDPEKEYEGKPNELPMPIEWRAEIIRYHIEKKMDNVEYQNHNAVDHTFVVVFNTKENAEENEVKFHATIIKSMNEYISIVKEENPKKYYRGLVLETSVDGISFNIKY
jgi:hypothetical protein